MKALFSLCVAAFLSWVALTRTQQFSQEAVLAPLLAGKERPPSEEVRAALSQPYHYLSSGRQAYVFVSEDGKTVLKLFKKAYLCIPWYTPLLPKQWREKERLKRERRLFFYANSYRLAESLRQRECGLLYVHLMQAGHLPSITVHDRASRQLQIDLQRTPFVLQRCGESLSEAFDRLFAQEGLSGVKRGIELFLLSLQERIQQGIADADHDVEKNFGFYEGRLLHFDPGRFFLDESLKKPARLQKEWWSATHRFRRWLEKSYPELLPFFDEKYISFL